jgi:hypothetical protein
MRFSAKSSREIKPISIRKIPNDNKLYILVLFRGPRKGALWIFIDNKMLTNSYHSIFMGNVIHSTLLFYFDDNTLLMTRINTS